MNRNRDTEVFSSLVDVADRVVVDVGSGAGGFVAWLNQEGATAFGIECSGYMLSQSKASFNEPHQLCGVGQQLPFTEGSVSVVSFMNSLHHIPADQMDVALAEAVRILIPGGTLYVLEPVAEGPGYETAKLIDDEAEVRSLAQHAMNRAVERGLDQTAEGRYTNQYTYAHIDGYFEMMVGVDETRAQQVEQHRKAVSETFHRLGTESAAGVSFDHPMHYRLFVSNRL